MTYPINTTIPAAGNNPSLDQQPMMQNFANINSYLGVDHTTPGTNPGDGQHNQVTFHINQSAPSIANGVSGLFANLVSSASQLFFQNASGSVQLTGLTISGGGGNFGISTPWGIKLNWGVVVPSSGGTSVTFAVAFSSNTNVFLSAQSTSTGNVANIVTASSITGSGFKAYSSGSPSTNYFAIGF